MVVNSLLILGSIALLFAILLYITSRSFKVHEDPRVKDLEEILPGINCGACGFPGCSGMASELVSASKTGDISALSCPPGGTDVMDEVAEYFGLSAGEAIKKIAVLRCGGTCETAPAKTMYDGPASCVMVHNLYSGENGCPFACVGQADCSHACPFDAISMNPETGLPEVDPEECTACGICVSTCPRNLFELRPVGKRERRVWVNCQNHEKGAVSKKNCSVSCIGCGLCVKACPEKIQAITMNDNLAYIDTQKCIACGLCVPVCPTKAIVTTFEVKQPKKETQKA
jgi:electron transport complex protein RnfB